MTPTDAVPAPDAVAAARVRLGARIRHTPLLRSAWLSDQTGAEVWLKLETLQRSGSFKIRGALNAALSLVERGERARLVTASAGNHGRALAEAAREAGLACTVFTPATAPRAKRDAIVAAGATLDAASHDYDTAEEAARAHAAQTGGIYVSPYNHPDVIAGAGTVALDILDDVPTPDAIVVPVGGGGLVSGIALAVHDRLPGCEVIGVEAAVNPAFREARVHGRITPIPVTDSLADGLVGNLEAGSITYAIVERLVPRLAEVAEAAIADAIRDLVAREHLVVEGAGAVAAAALASGALPHLRDRRVVVILSGANIDLSRLAPLLTPSPRH